MADSTTNLPTISVSQSNKESTQNGINDALSPSSIFGRNFQTCAALVFGYLGGRFNGTSVANGTVTATASATNYVVVHRTTLAVTIATTTTNWNNTATYGRMYSLVAGASTITSYSDFRAGADGILAPYLTGFGAGDMLLGTVQIVTALKTFGAAGAVSKFALAGTTSGSTVLDASAVASGTVTLPAGTYTVGYLNVPQNSQSAAYTTVLADAGKHLLHPAGDANARTFTIDSNANVPYPIGTAITFVNETSQVVSIAITADTLTLAGSTTTGTRSLAQNGVATALKVTSMKWIVSGTGLT